LAPTAGREGRRISKDSYEVSQGSRDSASTLDDKRLNLEIDSHGLLTLLAQIGAEPKARETDSGGKSDLGSSAGVKLLTIQISGEQAASSDRRDVAAADREERLSFPARRSCLRKLVRINK
jgi:hypothetical protein